MPECPSPPCGGASPCGYTDPGASQGTAGYGGNTNDSTPVMRVTLSGTLDAGEFVSFRRGTTVIVGHFLCHQNRANTTYNLLNDPDTGHPVAFSRAADGPMFPTRCSSCHDVAAGHPGTGSMPAGHFVAAPSGAPTYWCRCPA